MRSPLVLFAWLMLGAQPQHQSNGRVVTLALPHALRAGETAWLELTVGPLQRGMQIEIATTAGRPLGTVSPYGARASRTAGTYSVPVPTDAIARGRISVRVSVDRDGDPPRAPTRKEVQRLRMRIMPAPTST
jgi:hypothetical protein